MMKTIDLSSVLGFEAAASTLLLTIAVAALSGRALSVGEALPAMAGACIITAFFDPSMLPIAPLENYRLTGWSGRLSMLCGWGIVLVSWCVQASGAAAVRRSALVVAILLSFAFAMGLTRMSMMVMTVPSANERLRGSEEILSHIAWEDVQMLAAIPLYQGDEAYAEVRIVGQRDPEDALVFINKGRRFVQVWPRSSAETISGLVVWASILLGAVWHRRARKGPETAFDRPV